MAGSREAAPSSLSVFFPAYNDSGTIASLVIRALQTAARLTPNHEVIVVNYGSTDSTAQILDALAQVYPALRVVSHPENRGYGGALRSGFRAPASISSTATKSAVPIRGIASSSEGCTTTSSKFCTGTPYGTWPAKFG